MGSTCEIDETNCDGQGGPDEIGTFHYHREMFYGRRVWVVVEVPPRILEYRHHKRETCCASISLAFLEIVKRKYCEYVQPGHMDDWFLKSETFQGAGGYAAELLMRPGVDEVCGCWWLRETRPLKTHTYHTHLLLFFVAVARAASDHSR